MSTNLTQIIKDEISEQGFMALDRFMTLAMTHHEHGYYIKKDPFGRGGDFTTAPEISQIFGEVIGAWVADTWLRMGAPKAFALLECGAGRGTLMADILRVCTKVEGFIDACHVHLLDASPVLRDAQKEALAGYNVVWHETLESFETDLPVIVIGNEFLDALPILQFQYKQGLWRERVIELEEQGELVFRLNNNEPDPVSIEALSSIVGARKEGNIAELSAARNAFLGQIALILQKHCGAGVFIDYGHVKSAYGDTLQAVYKHKYCSVFDHIGNADITAHVDFDAAMQICAQHGLDVYAIKEQGLFLKALGIEARAQNLYEAANTAQKAEIATALDRLTGAAQMGRLFKVMGVSYGLDFTPAGF